VFEKWSQMGGRIDEAGRYFVVLGGFAIPLSTSLEGGAFFLASIAWLIGGGYREKLARIQRNRIALSALLLFAALGLGVLYSPTRWSEAFLHFFKYRDLVLGAILISLMTGSSWRERAINAFIIGNIVLLILSYLTQLGLWPYGNGAPGNAIVFKAHIEHSSFLALSAYIVASKSFHIKNPWLRTACWVFIVLVLINILFLVRGRIGFVVTGLLIFLFFFNRYRLRGIIYACLIILPLSLATFYFSGTLREGLQRAGQDLTSYEKSGGQEYSSLGYRLYMAELSARVMLENPFLGAGTGSFKKAYSHLTDLEWTKYHPHNEYLGIGMQIGVFGLGIFIYLLYSQWRASLRLPGKTRVIGIGFVALYAFGSILNPWMYDSTGAFWAFFTGVLFSGGEQPGIMERT